MIFKIKIIIKLLIYSVIDIFIKPSKEVIPKSLLIIRLDGIGDYVLFRNFLEILKKSEKYKDFSITLLGNNAWKDLSEEYDRDYIDKYIWLDRKSFINNIFYRYYKLRELVSKGYEVIISPVHSRDFFITDNIVKLINAKEKIGSEGDLSNILKWQKKISDKYYNTIIPVKNKVSFEFIRNKYFFESLLNTRINITRPTIEYHQKDLKYELPKKYAILFIGASDNSKKWSIENYKKVGHYLRSEYGYEIVLCGTQDDIEQANSFENRFDNKFLNLVGKTSLIELLTVIYNGDFILSNETSAPHFAAAMQKKNIFVIYSGKHYGRFTPYPKEICQNYNVVNHPDIIKNLDNYKKISNYYGYQDNLYINDISFKMVKGVVDSFLENNDS